MRKLIAVFVALIAGITAAVAFAAGANPTFTFSSDAAGITYKCALDNAALTNCSSPVNQTNLAAGAHTETIVGSFTVPSAAPTASFTFSPSAPVTGSPVHFDGTASTCSATPCTYQYIDTVNGAVLGTTQSFDRTFQAVGTKQVQLTVTDAQSRTAIVEHDVIVGPPSGGGGSCDLNATTANLAAQVAAATPGQTVCLASGTYTGFTGTSKAAPGITITAASGATVTFAGMNLNPSNVQNFTVDGTVGGGTMSVTGLLDIETAGNVGLNKALNLTFQNIAFPAADGNVELYGPENANITFNRDTFVDGNAACSGGSPTGLSGIFYVFEPGSPTTQTGLTIQNSVLIAPTDLWNPGRAVQDGAPMVFKNNVMVGFLDHTEGASCNHIDGLQWFSGFNGTTGSVTFTGNLCYDDYGCAMAFDGTASNTITDNACFDTETGCISLYSDSPGSTINHNVEQHGGADPGGCNTMSEPSAPIQSCSSSSLLLGSHKSGDRISSGETLTNNVGSSSVDDPLQTNSNNLFSGASSPNINGTPTFVGGANPTTWADFELTAGSAGHAGGSDGLDVGVRASAGGPPTGGGSAPVNTVAPALTGTATQGQALTTTDGTWTITGNIPTATTYQWFDCPTSTFTAASCPAIEAQTAPRGTNGPTYTLQASDAGKFVFVEVTQTNANGQINALSNAKGPVG